MWNKESLNKITSAFKAAGSENWTRLCKELNIRNGRPNLVVVDWKYGSKPTADEYITEARPFYDPDKNVVVVENPWSIASSVLKQMEDADFPILGTHVELDADVAMKILVFGEVP